MANDNNRWPPLSQAYTGSNHGDQPKSDSGFDRGNGGGRGNGVHEEPPVVINNSNNGDQQQSDSGNGGGRGNGVHEVPPVVINNGSNDGNNGNRNNIVFGDGYSNIGGNDQEGSSYSLKVNIPKMNENNYNEWAQTVRLKTVFCFCEIFAEIRREEARQEIMMGKTQRNSESEGSALPTRNLDEGRSDKVLWCDHCKREWHTRETCWKLKGKPPNWKKKTDRAFHASNSDQGQQPPPSQFPLTTEQLDRLYKLLESPTLSCSIATKGNSAYLSVSLSHTWIVDSGASDHMTGESTLFSSYSPCAGNQKIKIVDGSFSAIAGKGSVVLSQMLTLKNVLHVPNLSCNLISDLNSGKMIGSAKESGGLYYLEIGSASQLP
ncbi:hypothetical protein KIW84_042851 [Lathyrus oleraceus]|uniref:Retrovirus-related Pol polyprotein from transposon TNT 1-94-like beta-barrel domain-containing protein n=1 Tax=Pisum sativum TaxID=3888 RepID=A0A9D4XGL6_PEA|nr:hypothetical protein KIW84_042851 [Pisum sativum]